MVSTNWSSRTWGLTRQQHGVFLQRLPNLIRLPGQGTFIDFQVVSLDQDPISRKQVSCRYKTDTFLVFLT